MMTRSASCGAAGSVFFMQNGQLYMARTGMWDRAWQLHGRRRLTARCAPENPVANLHL
jgi:hypothetical protein